MFGRSENLKNLVEVCLILMKISIETFAYKQVLIWFINFHHFMCDTDKFHFKSKANFQVHRSQAFSTEEFKRSLKRLTIAC